MFVFDCLELSHKNLTIDYICITYYGAVDLDKNLSLCISSRYFKVVRLFTYVRLIEIVSTVILNVRECSYWKTVLSWKNKAHITFTRTHCLSPPFSERIFTFRRKYTLTHFPLAPTLSRKRAQTLTAARIDL